MNITDQLTQMREQLNLACELFQRAAKRVVRIVKRALRSCLWISSKVEFAHVNEPTSAAPQGVRTVLPDWPDSPDANYQYRCDRMRVQVEEEIAMEELHKDALELLIK